MSQFFPRFSCPRRPSSTHIEDRAQAAKQPRSLGEDILEALYARDAEAEAEADPDLFGYDSELDLLTRDYDSELWAK